MVCPADIGGKKHAYFLSENVMAWARCVQVRR